MDKKGILILLGILLIFSNHFVCLAAPLHEAVTEGNIEKVKKLIEEERAQVDIKDWIGWTPLMYAINLGNLEMVKYLIEKGADYNIKTKSGSLLELALYNRYPEIVDYLISMGVQPPWKNLFSPQEIKSCEEIISVALAAFKEKKYELLHSHFFQPPYYDAQDIKDDKEYFVSLLKMIEEELGDLEDYSTVPFYSIPRDGWMCYGESMFSAMDLKSSAGLYLKTYKAIFSKIKSFPVYIYVWAYLGVDQYSVRDFGVILPSTLAFGDLYGGINLKEIKSLEERKAIFHILFLQTRIYKQRGETQGEGYKIKVFADTPPGEGNGVTYLLPTKEGELIAFCVDYHGDSEDAEIQTAMINPPSKLQEGEKIYTFLTKGNEPLKMKYSFKNGEIINGKLELDSLKKEKTAKEEIFVESQGGFLINFDLEWKDGELFRTYCHPKVHPFSAGGLPRLFSAEEIAEMKKANINEIKEKFKKELNLD